MVLVRSPQREFTQKIERQGRATKVLGISLKKCTTMNKIFEVAMGELYKKDMIEAELVTRGLYEYYKKFHPKDNLEVVKIKKKFESNIEVIKDYNKMTITKLIKDEEEGFIHEVKVIALREELVALISVIKRLSKQYEKIPTPKIALEYCLELDIKKTSKGKDLFNGDFWVQFQGGLRSLHNKLTKMLRALADEDFIRYQRGETKLLKKDMSIDMILE